MDANRQYKRMVWAVCAALALSQSSLAAPPSRMLELEFGGRKYVGSVIAHNPLRAWFLERDGRLAPLDVAQVRQFHDAGRFRPLTTMELREQLSKELGREFQISIAGQYVVAGPPQSVDRLAPLFDNLYRDFLVTFAARGFKIRPPETPLIAVIYPDRAGFEQYCQAEGIRPQPGLRGFYLPISNRVVLYDTTKTGSESTAALDATVLHEATHQVAFNVGIHTRIGPTPKWVVEGLATAFEREAMRTNDHRGTAMTRINADRYARFQRFRVERRAPKSLTDFIQSDASFESDILDAYSQSWALTFFLLETRPAEYAKYLHGLAQRDPMKEYASEDRLRDFQAAFGRDLVMLEAHFLNFYQDLARSSASVR